MRPARGIAPVTSRDASGEMEVKTRNIVKVVVIERPEAGVHRQGTGRYGNVQLTAARSSHLSIQICRHPRLHFTEVRDSVRSQKHDLEREFLIDSGPTAPFIQRQ